MFFSTKKYDEKIADLEKENRDLKRKYHHQTAAKLSL